MDTRDQLIEVLQRELEASRTREQAALEREARLLGLLERLQPQISRGLAASSPHKQPQRPLREQILTLLQAHPAGLSRQQLEIATDAHKNLTDTLQGMVRAEKIVRLSTSFFALAPGPATSQNS